jgi:hypothetical protein
MGRQVLLGCEEEADPVGLKAMLKPQADPFAGRQL